MRNEMRKLMTSYTQHNIVRSMANLHHRPNSLDVCGREPYPERKSCGLKNVRIREDGASICVF